MSSHPSGAAIRAAQSPVRAPSGEPVLKGHHIRQIALLAVAASWAGIFYAIGAI